MRIAFVVLLATLTTAAGQQPPSVRTQQPARDRQAVQDPVGTGVIRGKVTNADGRPLRRVQISVSGEPLTQPKTTSTDSQGRFELTALPAGRFTLAASRPGYLSLRFGQSRPGEEPRTIELADGQDIENVDITLARSSVIAGRVTDETGEPLAGASVVAMQMRFWNGKRQLVPLAGIARSDDTGQYRVGGLEPGEYYVRASSRDTWQSDPPKRETMTFLPTFYPSTSSPTAAQRIRVRYGQELPGIDIGMLPGKVVSVSGTASSSDGRPLAGADLGLSFEIRGESFASFLGGSGSKANPDGTFVIRDVIPGDYSLAVQYTPSGGPPEAARTRITVGTDNVEGIQLVTGPAGTLSGRVAVDSAVPPSFALSRLQVRPMSPGGDMQGGLVGFSPQGGRVADDGAFEVKGVLGTYRLTVMGLPAAWAVRAVESDGRDVTTAGIDPLGQTVDRITITITDRFPTVTGTIRDAKGNPAPSATALLFPQNPDDWIPDLRTIRTARLTQGGVFAISAVRPGEYLAIAVPNVRSSEWNDPDFLESLRERATPVSVSATHTPTLDLVVKEPS